MVKGIVWLRNDLRISDHPALSRALQECDEVLFAYVFDDRVWKSQNGVSPNCQFPGSVLFESLGNLQEQIRDRGGKIEFLQGDTVEQISNPIKEYGASRCYAQREDAWKRPRMKKKLAGKCELILTEGKGLFENNDLPFDLNKLPGVFSSFRRKVEKNLKIRPLIVVPEKISCTWTPKNQLPILQHFGLDKFQADERAAVDFRGWRRCWSIMDERMDPGKGLSQNLIKKLERDDRFGLFIQVISLAVRWLFVRGSSLLGDQKI